MGLGRSDLQLFVLLKRKGFLPDCGRVAELGAQQLARAAIEATDVIAELGAVFGAEGNISIPPVRYSGIREGLLEKQAEDAPAARILWSWLRYEYTAIDIDGGMDSVPLDLNYDLAPYDQRGRYDLVTNFGTTEHVANQLNAFGIAHDLTAVGGVMVHNLPSQGFINHGLFNYSMKFFWHLARSNEYKWLYCDYVCSAERDTVPPDIIEAVRIYEPDIIERIANHTIPNGTIIVALQKQNNDNFVPPIDVPSGLRTRNKTLLQRYPRVFREVE